MVSDDSTADTEIDAIGVDTSSWTANVDVSEDGLAVGDCVTFSKPMTEADVRRFATASGDTNPLHLDAELAAKSRFDGPIVHGALVGGLLSAALARLPGLVIYLSQELTFVAPVPVGDEPTARVEVIDRLHDNRYRLATEVVREDDQLAIEGEATVLIDELPAGDR